MPFEYFDVLKHYPKYLHECLALAEGSGKRVLIFDLSDYTEVEVDIPHTWIFRIAEYASRSRKNVIAMPTFIEDLGDYAPIVWRKKGTKPVVGFCGWAGFRNLREWIKFLLKNYLLDIKSFFLRVPQLLLHKRGIFFRRRALATLGRSDLIEKNFIVRRSFSSHVNTIEKSPEELRREYIENISGSDLALSVRGDANSSCRLFEILSLGRVPLFVNTDCVLPLADEIDYKKFVVFAEYNDIDRLPEIATEFWQHISEEEFVAMQKAAREHFEKYLRVDSFLAYVLPKLIKK